MSDGERCASWHHRSVRVVQILLLVSVVAVAVAVALGWGDRMVSVPVDRAPTGIEPDSEIGAADIPGLRFNLALRGYRMAEVDAVLARLADALAARDGHIEELVASRSTQSRESSED